MNTTGLAMTVTDELLAELEAKTEKFVGFGIRSDTVAKLVFELRRLRAENAELERQNGMLTTAVSDVWKLKEGKIKSACLSQAGDATNWQAEEISRLNVENAELAKDAGRYRWLRDGAGYYDTRDIPGMAPQRMNEYIDTAMGNK